MLKEPLIDYVRIVLLTKIAEFKAGGAGNGHSPYQDV